MAAHTGAEDEAVQSWHVIHNRNDVRHDIDHSGPFGRQLYARQFREDLAQPFLQLADAGLVRGGVQDAHALKRGLLICRPASGCTPGVGITLWRDGAVARVGSIIENGGDVFAQVAKGVGANVEFVKERRGERQPTIVATTEGELVLGHGASAAVEFDRCGRGDGGAD